jgi:hypothetical protein
VWAPVYGNHGARHHPEDAPDASYRRNRDLLVGAERAGYDPLESELDRFADKVIPNFR